MINSNHIKTLGLRYLFPAVLLLASSASINAQRTDQNANLKAVFIYNFTMYFDWNAASTDADFIIGVIGSSPVKPALLMVAATKDVRGRKIVIKSFRNSADITACDMLFIPGDCKIPLSMILERVPEGTLTVSEKPGYAMAGACLNFLLVNNRLKFEANLDALSKARLKASSQLLKLAIIVNKQ